MRVSMSMHGDVDLVTEHGMKNGGAQINDHFFKVIQAEMCRTLCIPLECVNKCRRGSDGGNG